MDATTLSLLVSLAIALVRWGWGELKKEGPKDKRKIALAVGAMVLGAGFFVWMVFFRTMESVAGTTVYVLGRRLFRSGH